MDDVSRARVPHLLLSVIAVVMALFLIAAAGPDAASAKGKKVHACVVRKGPDKGVMHFSRSGKCHKGEKKVSWGKKGRRGKQGAAGQTGATGPQGPSGVTGDLLATIAAQQAAIDSLKSQLDTVKSQVVALCAQMSSVTTYANALGPVISGIALSGVIPPALGLTVPAVPAALSGFSCP
jgi:hypothetical protein